MSDHRPFFTIFSAGRNTGPEALAQCVNSVKDQDLSSWEMFLVSDGSGVGMWLQARDLAGRDSRIRTVDNLTRRGKAVNFYDLLPHMTGEVILDLDADDHLTTDGALSRIHALYSDDVGAVIGEDENEPEGKPWGQRTGERFMSTRSPRSWRRALSLEFLQRFGTAPLMDDFGRFYPYSADIAMVAPAIMLARCIRFISRTIYHANMEGVNHDFVQHATEQAATCQAIMDRLRPIELECCR